MLYIIVCVEVVSHVTLHSHIQQQIHRRSSQVKKLCLYGDFLCPTTTRCGRVQSWETLNLKLWNTKRHRAVTSIVSKDSEWSAGDPRQRALATSPSSESHPPINTVTMATSSFFIVQRLATLEQAIYCLCVTVGHFLLQSLLVHILNQWT